MKHGGVYFVRHMMNRGLSAAIGIALFTGGIAVGLLITRGRSDNSRQVTVQPSAGLPHPTDPPPSSPPLSHDKTDLLQQRVGELEAEVRKLRELQPRVQSENSTEFAALLYRDYLQMEKGGGKNPDPEKFREFLGRLSRLDGSSAGHFIERFRETRN